MATPMARTWPTSVVVAAALIIASIIALAFGADPVLANAETGIETGIETGTASVPAPASRARADHEPAVEPADLPVAGVDVLAGDRGSLDELVAGAIRNQLESIIKPASFDQNIAPAPPPAPQPAALPPIDAIGRTPSGWLTPVNRYWLSARFGEPGPWSSGHHTGLDFVAPIGTGVRAPVAGVVVAAAPGGAYGNLLQLRIAPGIELWFAHLRRFDVAVGAHVAQGQLIGRVGMTGHTTGPHSHFEVRVRGRARNPEPYFWPGGNTAERH